MDLFLKQFITKRKRKLPHDVQLRFLKRLHRLLENGYPLLEALEMYTLDKQLKKPAESIATALKNGTSLDAAFDQAGFHQAIIAYLYFVQANGSLQETIEKSIQMFEYRTNTTKRFQRVFRYPIILLLVFSILLYFINRHVLPSFQNLFQSSAEASNIVSITIIIINGLSSFLFFASISIILCIIGWYFLHKKVPIEKQLKLYNSIPLYRNLVKMQTSFLFATHFSTLLKAGLPYKEILIFLANQTKLPIIAYYSNQMIDDLKKGIHLAHVLSEYTFLDYQLTNIFQKNTNHYALEKDLSIYAHMLLEDIENNTIKVITYLQPAFFLIIACFVIFIYAIIMWPMFELIKTI